MPARPLLPCLLLAVLLAPPSARAAPPPAAAPAAQRLPVGPGDVVKVDLSKVPVRVERRGSAICLGYRMTAVGTSEPITCERPFTFDAPVAGDPIVLVFEPKAGGAPQRYTFPLERDPRPRTVTAPSAGTLTQLAPAPAKAGAPPEAMPADLKAKARAAAAEACGQCPREGAYKLKDLTVAAAPAAALEVTITVQPAPKAP